jgi:hypothetical protein
LIPLKNWAIKGEMLVKIAEEGLTQNSKKKAYVFEVEKRMIKNNMPNTVGT